MKVMTKKRIPNFEIIRVLAMYFIVVWHFIRHGLLQDSVETYCFDLVGFLNFSLMQIIMIITVMAVNLYVLITGYFMIQSKPKWNKIPHLWLQVFIYSILIYGGVILMNKNVHVSIKDIVHNSLVIRYNAYWFVTKYMALVLLSPFINKCAQNINRKSYRLLLIILFFMDVALFKFFYGENYSGGQSLFHFINLYLIAGYIRLWKPFSKMKPTKICLTLLCFIFVIFVMETSMECLKCIYHHENLNFHLSLGLIGNNEFTLFTSVLFFLWISRLKINANNCIARVCMRIAPMTFAVYLISDNNYIRPILWKWVMDNPILNSNFLFVEILIYSFWIFIVCVVIDSFMKRLMVISHLDRLTDNVYNRIKYKLNSYLE